jgi:hypothetical protein
MCDKPSGPTDNLDSVGAGAPACPGLRSSPISDKKGTAGGPLKHSVRLSGAVLSEDADALLLVPVFSLSIPIRFPLLLRARHVMPKAAYGRQMTLHSARVFRWGSCEFAATIHPAAERRHGVSSRRQPWGRHPQAQSRLLLRVPSRNAENCVWKTNDIAFSACFQMGKLRVRSCDSYSRGAAACC